MTDTALPVPADSGVLLPAKGQGTGLILRASFTFLHQSTQLQCSIFTRATIKIPRLCIVYWFSLTAFCHLPQQTTLRGIKFCRLYE